MGNGLSVLEKECERSMIPVQLMTTTELLARKKSIQELQEKVMVEGIDFGVIPGCKKPSLFKPGAETLNVTFGLRPVLNPQEDIIVRDMGNAHREYQVTVHIMAAGAEKEIATGIGSCTTMESKHRYRDVERICPKCKKPAIIKGKEEYGGGWVCYTKKGGCNAKFKDDDPAITNQEVGQKENENPADQYNTCLKMAKKRALVDGTINATGASHVFTQDIEDMRKELIRDAEFTEVQDATTDTKKSIGEEKPQDEAGKGQDEPEKAKQNQIIAWGMEMAGRDGAKAEEFFIKWTKYVRKDKSIDPGLKNPFDLKGKRLDVTVSRAQKDYYAWKEKNAAH